MRPVPARLVPAAIGLALLAALWGLGMAGVPVMPHYAAAWRFVLSVPAGALLLVGGIEALAPAGAAGRAATLAPLRALLPQMPVAALLGVPVLARPGAIASGMGAMPLLLSWSALALALAAPSPPCGRRRVLAGLAALLVLAAGTPAAFGPLGAGPVGPPAQALSALALATLMARPPVRAALIRPLLIAVAVWAAAHPGAVLVAEPPGAVPRGPAFLLAPLPVLAATLGVVVLPVNRVQRLGVPLTLLSFLVLLARMAEDSWPAGPVHGSVHAMSVLAAALALAGLFVLVAGLWRAGLLPGLVRADPGR